MVFFAYFPEPNKVVDATMDCTDTTVIVNWSPPEGEFTGYRVRLSPGDAKKSKMDINDVNKTRAEFSGLTPNKKYKVHVMTLSGQVESEKVTVQDTTSESILNILNF